jgi:peptidyl-prolyl cis-trans isomerase SurA
MHSQLLRSVGLNRHLFLALGVVAATGLVAACTPSPAPPPPVSADAWAVVDGKEIKSADVEKAYLRRGDTPQTPSEEEALAAKLELLEEMITEEILLAKARALKIEATEAEIDTAFADAKKNITDEAFQQELARRKLTTADMRDGLRRQRLAQKVIEQEVVSKITVTDQEATDFFNANRAQFNLPEDAYHLAQIIVTPVRDAQLANRTGDDATTPQAAAAKVQMLMERLKGGTAFRDLAMDFSEDPESAPRGGDLGLVPLSAVKQAAPALRDAVLNVTPGSARVVSQGGAHSIVYVVARETAGQRDLSTPDVRPRITETLKARREQLLRAAYLTVARTDADVVNYLARRVVQSQGKTPK